MLTSSLAFAPLIDPITALYPDLTSYWLWLAIPLIIGIGIIYKGTRITNLGKLPLAVTIWSVQVLVAMLFAAVALSGAYWIWIRMW